MARQSSRDAVIRQLRAMHETVDEIGRVCEGESIDCGFVRSGSLMAAVGSVQLARVRSHVRREREWGIAEEGFRELSVTEFADRVRVANLAGGAFLAHCARVNPARLVRGLADVVRRQGVTIHEGTAVTAIRPGVAVTPLGSVRARTVLRCTEGYTAQFDGHRRDVLPLNSSMIVTEPLPASVWDEIGWSGLETLSDAARVYYYAQRTSDDRIAIGGRGVPYRFASRPDRRGETDPRTPPQLHALLKAALPQIGDAVIEHTWSGVLGVHRDWTPVVHLDRTTGLGSSGGYAGIGVAASNLCARALADLVLERDTDLVRLPVVNRAVEYPLLRGLRAGRWEPEPLRWVGSRVTYGLYHAADRRESSSGRASRLGTLATFLSGRR